MNCRRIEELIPLYVEGDLETGKADAVLTHTQACAHCNQIIAEYKASQDWLRSGDVPDFDDASLDALRAGAMKESGDRR